MTKIELDLDRADISVEEFTEALSAQVRLVREVMISMGIPSHEVRWVISELRSGSAYAAASPQVLGEKAYLADIDHAIRQAGEGYAQLATATGNSRPKYFNDEALKISRRLTELATRADAGRARLRFGTTAVAPSPFVAANVDSIIKGDLPSIGSIEGQLVRIEDNNGAYRIGLRDRFRQRTVVCHIPESLVKSALGAFDRRVIVRGRLWSRRDGTPLRIDVRSFEVIAEDNALPTWDAVRGILRNYERADGE